LRDKVLAEFIIDLARKSGNEKDFKGKLDEVDADFTTSFISSLFNIIKKMLPPEEKHHFVPPSMPSADPAEEEE
jgi:hypothetical protein